MRITGRLWQAAACLVCWALPQPTATALKAIARQFANSGTEGLENSHIFNLPEIVRAGGLNALKILGEPSAILHEAKQRIFAA